MLGAQVSEFDAPAVQGVDDGTDQPVASAADDDPSARRFDAAYAGERLEDPGIGAVLDREDKKTAPNRV